ncbi:cytochrome P450 [Streptomyces sp. 1331.2]|uniref:cytochrome P450 n=1 Tax=Streptomyces sp. 1331.2 TaxID=1938835 RepID=UPI000BD5CF8A|nr:cytochrome P450 [Streptomyces sp. 1331.2]SOB86012.1 Cytochrome P450 [Streptomyces sp. 1331.2]
MPEHLPYDPLDPSTLHDPYPVYARLRRHAPVHWHEALDCWVLTRYDDCLAVVHDHERFARDRRRVGAELPAALESLQTLDPPEQIPLRRLYLAALRRFDATALRQHFGQRLSALLTAPQAALPETTDGAPGFDFVSSVAVPLSLLVSCELLGVPAPDPAGFAEDADAIVLAMDAHRAPEVYRRGAEARARLDRLIGSWLRDPVPGSLLSHVLDPAAAGDIPEHHIHHTVRVMLMSGYMAMSSCMGNLVAALLSHPTAAQQLRDRRLLRTGVDELLRFDSPVTGTTRFATVDVTVGGRSIRRGDGVLCLYAAANRDPDRFPKPDELVLDRTPNDHFGYSWGTHACIGRAVAQGLLEDLVTAVVSLPRPLTLAAAPVRRPTATLRGLSSLPVTVR